MVTDAIWRYPRLYRLNEDGTPDTRFDVQVGNDNNQGVSAVAIQRTLEGEKILIGGPFTYVNEIRALGLARINDDGTLDTNFSARVAGPVRVIRMWTNEMFFTGTAREVVRHMQDGSADPSFLQARNVTYSYGNISPEPSGAVVIAAESFSEGAILLRLNPDGSRDTNFVVRLDHFVQRMERDATGALIIVGAFSSVNCIKRTAIARLIASDVSDSLDCYPPPEKPPPLLGVTRLGPARMVCSWPVNYPEYTLQATRRLRPNHPEREKWKTVTNAPLCSETECVVTNRIARWGKYYRLVKPEPAAGAALE